MASNIKKAGAVIRNSFRTKRYTMFDANENNYILSPKKVEANNNNNNNSGGGSGRFKVRSVGSSRSTSACSDEKDNVSSRKPQSKLKRTTSMTQSMRLAVGTLKQKLKKSSKRGQQQATPKKAGARGSSEEVHLYSPFKIDTPSAAGHRSRMKVFKNKSVCSNANLETPTRLRREVEALTANMQALSALTPNTLHNRCRARRSSPITSKTLRTPRSTRKRIVLE